MAAPQPGLVGEDCAQSMRRTVVNRCRRSERLVGQRKAPADDQIADRKRRVRLVEVSPLLRREMFVHETRSVHEEISPIAPEEDSLVRIQ